MFACRWAGTEALEFAEHPFLVLLVDPGALVMDRNAEFALFLPCAHRHLPVEGRVFDGIGEKVVENAGDITQVGLKGDRVGGRLKVELDALLRCIFTVLPLFLNLYALNRINSATVGILLYINPMMNFAIAFLVFGETISPLQGVGYAIILVALVLFNYPNLQKIRSRLIQ